MSFDQFIRQLQAVEIWPSDATTLARAQQNEARAAASGIYQQPDKPGAPTAGYPGTYGANAQQTQTAAPAGGLYVQPVAPGAPASGYPVTYGVNAQQNQATAAAAGFYGQPVGQGAPAGAYIMPAGPGGQLNQGGAVADGIYALPPGMTFPTPVYLGPVGTGGQQIGTTGAAASKAYAQPVDPTAPAVGYLGQVGANAQQGETEAAARPSGPAAGAPEKRRSISKKSKKKKKPSISLPDVSTARDGAGAQQSETTAASASGIYAPQFEQTTPAPPGYLGPVEARAQQNETGAVAYIGPAGMGAQPFQGGTAAYPYPYQFQQGMPNAYGPMPPMQAGANSGRPIYQIFYNPFASRRQSRAAPTPARQPPAPRPTINVNIARKDVKRRPAEVPPARRVLTPVGVLHCRDRSADIHVFQPNLAPQYGMPPAAWGPGAVVPADPYANAAAQPVGAGVDAPYKGGAGETTPPDRRAATNLLLCFIATLAIAFVVLAVIVYFACQKA
ncbi:hypothetical protein MTO96_007110 [Rhipicephalus appendiculatus]